MRIEEFNGLPAEEAAALLRSCADAGEWADALVAKRPYPDLATLLGTAEHLAEDWAADDVEQAIAHHPRIGERPEGPGTGAALSRSEQAGIDGSDTGLAQRLAEGNRRYEERFGRIYLVRAKGRTGEELLALLEERLMNDPATELAITTQQLREIALLRLEGLFA